MTAFLVGIAVGLVVAAVACYLFLVYAADKAGPHF